MRTITFILSLGLIFIIPWEGVIRIPGFGNAVKFFGIMVAGCWVVIVVLTGRIRKLGPFHIMVAIFVLWNGVTIFWSADPDSTILQLMTWVQLFFLVWVLWDLYATRSAIIAGLQAYVLGAYVAFGGAVSNFLSGNAFYTHYQRYSPGEINPDGFGFLLALGIPVAWYLANRQGTENMGLLWKVVNYVYVPVALLGIALSGTRTASIAAVVGMAYGLVSLSRLRIRVQVLIILFLAATVFISLPYLEGLRSFQRLGTTLEELTEGDIQNRTFHWADGLDSFAQQPLLGVGSNMYRSITRRGNVAHNSYLSILVESGLIGFILFSVILTIVVIAAWRQPKWDKRFWLTMLLVWAIGASTLTWEHRKTTWLFFSLIIANAALVKQQVETSPIFQRHKVLGPYIPPARMNELPQGE